jgi:heavy metal sensor kinase
MNTRSLRFRLIIWYAGLLTFVFLLFAVAAYDAFRHYLERSLAEALFRRSQQISVSLLANIDSTGASYVANQIQARYAPENFERFIRVTDANGKVIYASGKAPSFDPSGLPVLKPSQVASDSWRIETLGDGSRLLVTMTVYAPAAATNARSPGLEYLIESGGPMQPIESMLWHFMSSLLLGLPLVALVAVAGGYFLVGRALAPVVQAAQSAERITLHNLDERLPVSQTGDELEQLSTALDRMITRLRDAFDQNRRFLADASHELRTPLAALRGEMESAVAGCSSLEEFRDRVGSALEEVDRLSKIVDRLFAISRLDAGDAQQEWARFDLARLASTTADQMSLLADDKGISVSCNVEENVEVEGDSARIKQVVVNLLDNAIKYTPSGGSIQLNVRRQERKAVMEVVDTGIGIPAAALPHVFERFFRVDAARSREVDGAGLGLAIVKSICSAHGGRVEVESSENHGSRFRVELPLWSQT